MSADSPQRLYLLQNSTATIPTASGPLHMSSGCYLIQTRGGRNVLVDTGMAAPPAPGRKNVLEHLAELKVATSDIATVICTHFDVDHCGFHEHFPGAEFVVQREHYEVARGGHPRYASGRQHWDNAELRYRLIDGDSELSPGITLLKTSGHVAGHQSVLLRLPEPGMVLLAIDAVAMQRSFTPERKATPLDDNEEQLRASTQKLLDIMKRENVRLVVFHHDGEQWASLKKAPEYYGQA
jgi:N-acyl homoserine lactone hydrolase